MSPKNFVGKQTELDPLTLSLKSQQKGAVTEHTNTLGEPVSESISLNRVDNGAEKSPHEESGHIG